MMTMRITFYIYKILFLLLFKARLEVGNIYFIVFVVITTKPASMLMIVFLNFHTNTQKLWRVCVCLEFDELAIFMGKVFQLNSFFVAGNGEGEKRNLMKT